MAYVIIKSDERKAHERYVERTFGLDQNSSKERLEASEHVAARTREAVKELKRMEDK